jgi:catechol 2,3-dioxygenase-like lactoylglutathione lyase family enzyme
MEQRISFITLGVADLARAKAFYEALGWKASKSGEGLGIVFFQAGGQVFALFPREELAKDAGVENTPAGGFSGVTLAHNVRSKEAADAVMAEALAAGASPVKPLHDVFWGGYSGYFADPDGHLWEVCYNPYSKFGDDGSVYLSDS